MVRKKERVREVQISFVRKLPLEVKACPQCGRMFEGVKTRRYCSRACQAKSDYGRHADTYRQRRMVKYYQQKGQAGKE